MFKKKPKIFLIDDEVSILNMYSTKFQLEGFLVETASDGTDAIPKIIAFRPDLIFLDIVMAKVDGIELLKKIKRTPETKWIPVVMLTNIDNASDKKECFTYGASQYLIKVDQHPGELVRYARELLKYT